MLDTDAGTWGTARTKQTSQSRGACMVAGGRQTINKPTVNDIRRCEAYAEKPSPETDSEC